MKITISEILNAKPVIEELVEQDISIKTAYRLSRIIKELNNELQTFEEQRQKLVHKHGKQVEDAPTGNVVVPEENMEVFQKDLSELLTATLNLNCEPMRVEEFGDIKIKTSRLLLMDSFLTE